MDVTGFYTNIPQEEGRNTVCQAYDMIRSLLWERHPHSGLSIQSDICLNWYSRKTPFSLMGGATSRVTEPRWGARSQWPLRTFLCPELKQKLSVNARLMLGHIFAQSALLYALLFVIINIYSVYSIYFGLGHINFIQEYIIYTIYQEISMFRSVRK